MQTNNEARADSQIEGSTANRRTKVIVATTVMLSFISFWRAAAIVLNDLGSSAYYVGGIAEQAVGRASPWFVVSVMLFSFGKTISVQTAENAGNCTGQVAFRPTF